MENELKQHVFKDVQVFNNEGIILISTCVLKKTLVLAFNNICLSVVEIKTSFDI